MVLWYDNSRLGGSLVALFRAFLREGFFVTVYEAWAPYFFGSRTAWTIIGVFAATQLAFMKVLPGPQAKGPETPGGHVPVYKANGWYAYLATLFAFFLGGFVFRWFSPGIVYDHFGALLGALNLVAVALCVLLYAKGRLAPSGPDVRISGNPILDYYWGIELYPRILGWDVKHFTNSRFGMMGWGIIVLSCAAWQYEHHGHVATSMGVCVALQLLYLAQFFWWETGYFRTLDIQHDRAGFYLCWGTLVWVPAVYTLAATHLVEHPVDIGPFWTIVLLGLGGFFITAKNLSNRDRLRVRDTNGQTTVWGRPPEVIRAKYMDARGNENENLLLASGFWGLSRHFHYVGEILGAFCWSATAGFRHATPFLYVAYLTVLLTHRARRDDRRCQKKYGRYWDEYRSRVPWKILPGVY